MRFALSTNWNVRRHEEGEAVVEDMEAIAESLSGVQEMNVLPPGTIRSRDNG